MGRGLVSQATGTAGGVTKLSSLCSALHRLHKKLATQELNPLLSYNV